MSNDVARVYLFLAKQGDWVSQADKNGDGAVIKSEFRTFMEESFEWNGEESADAKNDLINSFWKTIDTNQSGKVSGTNLKNKNALDKKELAAMESRIEMYEILNEFISQLSAPSVVQDSSSWKKSVSEGLGALIEPYIKNGGSADELYAYLEAQSPLIEAKATADYCANEYLADVMGDVANKYGYAYGSDSTLQGMINKYIQGMTTGTDATEIQQVVQGIIDSYIATAGLGEEGAVDMGDYGYIPTANSPLNDLQKAIIKTKLKEQIIGLNDYDDYKDLYDEAITTYLDSLKFGDFANVSNGVMTAFKASNAYKSVTKAIATEDVFSSDELRSALTSAISESFASRITGLMNGELTAFDNLVNEAKNKAKNGDFDSANGELDKNKLINWIVQQAKANIADFYPNGLGNMSLNDLNIMYDALVESAKENKDASKVKDAALQYCKAIASKNSKFAEVVADVFGDNYATTINKKTTGEIDALIQELKDKIIQLGDVTSMTDYEKNALLNEIQSSYNVSLGVATTFNLPNSAKCGGNTITSDRISYAASGCLTVNNSGEVTIDTNTAGTFTGTVTIYIDGIKIASKQITVTVNKIEDMKNITTKATSSNLKNDSGISSNDGGFRIWGNTGSYNNTNLVDSNITFADLYNGNYNIELGTTSKKDKVNQIYSRINNLGDWVITALTEAGADKDKLKTAVSNVCASWLSNVNYIGKVADKGTGSSQRNKAGSTYNQMSDKLTNGTYSGIIEGEDTKGNNQRVIMINFKEFVDAILAEYKKL